MFDYKALLHRHILARAILTTVFTCDGKGVCLRVLNLIIVGLMYAVHVHRLAYPVFVLQKLLLVAGPNW